MRPSDPSTNIVSLHRPKIDHITPWPSYVIDALANNWDPLLEEMKKNNWSAFSEISPGLRFDEFIFSVYPVFCLSTRSSASIPEPPLEILSQWISQGLDYQTYLSPQLSPDDDEQEEQMGCNVAEVSAEAGYYQWCIYALKNGIGLGGCALPGANVPVAHQCIEFKGLSDVSNLESALLIDPPDYKTEVVEIFELIFNGRQYRRFYDFAEADKEEMKKVKQALVQIHQSSPPHHLHEDALDQPMIRQTSMLEHKNLKELMEFIQTIYPGLAPNQLLCYSITEPFVSEEEYRFHSKDLEDNKLSDEEFAEEVENRHMMELISLSCIRAQDSEYLDMLLDLSPHLLDQVYTFNSSEKQSIYLRLDAMACLFKSENCLEVLNKHQYNFGKIQRLKLSTWDEQKQDFTDTGEPQLVLNAWAFALNIPHTEAPDLLNKLSSYISSKDQVNLTRQFAYLTLYSGCVENLKWLKSFIDRSPLTWQDLEFKQQGLSASGSLLDLAMSLGEVNQKSEMIDYLLSCGLSASDHSWREWKLSSPLDCMRIAKKHKIEIASTANVVSMSSRFKK